MTFQSRMLGYFVSTSWKVHENGPGANLHDSRFYNLIDPFRKAQLIQLECNLVI